MTTRHDPIESWDDVPTQPLPLDRWPPCRVLVAENEATLRTRIAEHLRAEGCDVLETGRGDVALRLIAQSEDPDDGCALDLAILDMKLPGLSGFEVADQLRTLEYKTRVLLLADGPEPGLVADLVRFGVAVLEKPFDGDELTRVVVTLTSREVRVRAASSG